MPLETWPSIVPPVTWDSEAPLVPTDDGESLYIRPTIVETSEGFGIKTDAYASEALMYIVTTVNLGKALYSSAEGKGLKVDACKEYIRAWPGGTGSYKLGANYGELGFRLHFGFAQAGVLVQELSISRRSQVLPCRSGSTGRRILFQKPER